MLEAVEVVLYVLEMLEVALYVLWKLEGHALSVALHVLENVKSGC
jgi:hypothetical protein